MAIDAVSSSTSAAAAQLIEQTRQANAKPEATETRASETRAEQRPGDQARARSTGPAGGEHPRPGNRSVINTFA